MTHRARFEVVRGNGGWWARFIAPNGRTVFTTETYTRRANALKAIDSLAAVFHGNVTQDDRGVTVGGWAAAAGAAADIGYVDERAGNDDEAEELPLEVEAT